MADQNWKSRIDEGREAARDSARAAVDSLSHNAREAAATARSRIGSTYGSARSRVDTLADGGRDLAATSLDAASRAAAKGKTAVDKAVFASRGLVAERPIAAIAIGVTAGIVLGFLANRLATAQPAETENDDIDEWDA